MLEMVAGTGPTVEWNTRLARGTATVGRAIVENRPIATPDLLADPRIMLDPDARARIERSGYQAVLAVPLSVKGRVIGALAVGDVRGRVFDDRDARVLQSFADQAATVMENARLYAEERAAREDADAANRAKDVFLAMLGHELRNLLAAITTAVAGPRIVAGPPRPGSTPTWSSPSSGTISCARSARD